MRGDVKEKWVVFPDSNKKFEKILMIYSLKCDPLNTPYKCGEWDYLTYTYASKKTGQYQEFPNFLVNDAIVDTYSYILNPGWNYSPRKETSREKTLTKTEKYVFIGDSLKMTSKKIIDGQNMTRCMFLWTASELSGKGLLKKEIQGISINSLLPGFSGRLTIRMKLSSKNILLPDSNDQSGFTMVYDQNTIFQNTGWNYLLFEKGFLWDSVSNIIVDVSVQNNQNPVMLELNGNDDLYNQNLLSKTDFSLFFEDKDYIDLPVSNASTLNKTVSISFWAKGNSDYMPENSYLFEAIDANNRRILNSHLPWSNGRIYWDAGNDGSGYDRIDKDAQVDEYEGHWNFWTMTKDVTKGEMKIFLNGKLWHSGTGKTKSLSGITKFVIGATANGKTTNYDGWIDEFGVWNKVLTENEILSLMHNAPTAASDGLILFCGFDEGTGTITKELISGKDLKIIGVPQWKEHLPDEKFKNFYNSNFKPHIIFDQGDYNFNYLSKQVIDSNVTDVQTIIYYNDPIKVDVPTDTIYVWESYSIPVFDTSGKIISKKAVNPDTTIYLKYRPASYDPKFAVLDRYEIGRYITPYGINLDLGEGFTWVYDVSDYAPILRDSVKINSGNWQELHDLKFYFIEGTPARDPKRVINLWNGNPAYNANAEKFLVPKTIFIKNDEKNARLKMRTTGHGMGGNDNCAEFCPKTHTILINGVKRYDHFVWRDNCAVNPLYPQGGTWIYQRANWCPGAEVYTHDFEITPFMTPDDSVTIDYNLQEYTWNGQGSQPSYVIASQLITYGEYNFKNEAAIMQIIRPNDWEYYLRENPSCLNPKVIIMNNGSEILTSLMIQYGSANTDLASFLWKGSLNPLQNTEVELPFYWGSWDGGETFRVTVSLPNGKADEYPQNNTLSTTFKMPEVYSNELLFYLKTNNAPGETSYRLIDGNDKIWYERPANTLAANKLYIDTFHLPNTFGCYRLELFDNDEDGINFWANNDGNGTARLKARDGQFYPSINPDFGSYTAVNFTTGWKLNTKIISNNDFVNFFPNPANDKLFAEINLYEKQTVSLSVFDLLGNACFSSEYYDFQSDIIEINLDNLKKGIYLIKVQCRQNTFVKKVIIE